MTADTSWINNAKCASLKNGIADYLFFTDELRGKEKAAAIEEARDICNDCPVRRECLKFAIQNPDLTEYGMWGGLTPSELKRLRRLYKRQGEAALIQYALEEISS